MLSMQANLRKLLDVSREFPAFLIADDYQSREIKPRWLTDCISLEIQNYRFECGLFLSSFGAYFLKQNFKAQEAFEKIMMIRKVPWNQTTVLLTSLVMYPSPLMSYKLKAQLSLSFNEPLDSTDKPVTNSCMEEKQEKKNEAIGYLQLLFLSSITIIIIYFWKRMKDAL